MTKISEHFTLEELTYSKTAISQGVKNEPNAVQTVNLCRLIWLLVEPLRQAWGSGITITSGFRGFRLKEASSTSVHPLGLAVDMVPANGKIAEFKQFVRDWLHETGAQYDQYIDEYRNGSQWVHLGLTNAAGKQRCQDLITTDGKNYKLLPRWTK